MPNDVKKIRYDANHDYEHYDITLRIRFFECKMVPTIELWPSIFPSLKWGLFFECTLHRAKTPNEIEKR